MNNKKQTKNVYVIQENNQGKSRWLKVGVAFVNKDNSLNVILNSLPMGGKLHIRDQSIKK